MTLHFDIRRGRGRPRTSDINVSSPSEGKVLRYLLAGAAIDETPVHIEYEGEDGPQLRYIQPRNVEKTKGGAFVCRAEDLDREDLALRTFRIDWIHSVVL